jgi:crotonobetainyl-CoA:carnitine CoA-transferase CaiB-like acyl-CoA transferase
MGLRQPAPHLGQHTREVLGELGLTTDEIDALASRRIIG